MTGADDPGDPDLRLRRLSVEVPAQTIAIYREVWAAIEAEMGDRIEEAELIRIVLERARVSPEGASTPAQISICSHCERGWQSGPGGRAELARAEIERARCDAEYLGSVDGDPGRKTATLTPKKRARILARDHHRCTVPGCRSKRNLDVHHIVHREDGGGHEDWNVTTLCSGHHARHHAGRLAIEGRAPNALRFAFRRGDEGHGAHVGANERQAHVGANERPADVGANERPAWARASIRLTRAQLSGSAVRARTSASPTGARTSLDVATRPTRRSSRRSR